MWLKMHIQAICDRIVADREANFALRVAKPPRHLSSSPPDTAGDDDKEESAQQDTFL